MVAAPLAQAMASSDLAADYGVAANPNGVWSYGWEAALNSTLNLYNTAVNGSQWYDINHHSGDNTPTIWKNNGLSTSYGVAPGEVSLHPGWDGSFSVARWTAATAGQLTVSGYFGAGDIGSMSDYIVFRGQAPLQQWLSNPSTVGFSFNTAVNAGDTLDFVVGVPMGGGYGFGNTPVAVTISAVPESQTWVLTLAGLGALGVVALRRSKAAGHAIA